MRESMARVALMGFALLAVACESERPAYALTSTGRILSFDTSDPRRIDSEVSVSGLASDESLVQLDYRPATGQVYCLTSRERLCTVDPRSGAVSIVNATAISTTDLANPVIDFNPVVDRLRVITAEQNLRVNPATGVREWLARNEEPTWPASLAEHFRNPAPELAQETLDTSAWRDSLKTDEVRW